MRRIAFINEKGGTCKTTLAVNIAAYFAEQKGLRVLLLDLDTQGHAGKSLGVDVRSLSRNIFHFLLDEAVRLEEVVQATAVSNLWLLPSYKDMSEFPTAIASNPRRFHRLLERLDSPRDRRRQLTRLSPCLRETAPFCDHSEHPHCCQQIHGGPDRSSLRPLQDCFALPGPIPGSAG